MKPPPSRNILALTHAFKPDGIWTRENYSENDVSEWYNDWYKDNIEGDDQIDETFAAYWGLGPSFSCDILNQCEAPQCSALRRPDQAYDYENAAMFLASMSNFNAVCWVHPLAFFTFFS